MKTFYSLVILLISISISMFFVGMFTNSLGKEGFDTVPIKYANDAKTIVVYGYYKVDDSKMAAIPYGYVVDPNDPTKIIPKTKDAKNTLAFESDDLYSPEMPQPGQKMPDGYYILSDASLGVLPPNMSPNLIGIDFESDTSYAPVIWKYDKSYISQTLYYAKKYTTTKHPPILAPGVYYVDAAHSQVSVLQDGMIADLSNGFGAIVDPKLSNPDVLGKYNKLSQQDIGTNYDVQFHDSIDDIKSQNKGTDLSFGEVRVRNQNGDVIVLPKIAAQEFTTFYTPGEFKYGASTYVPNYEDSVYLSAISNKQFAPSPYDYNSCASKACAVYQYVQNTLSPYCANSGKKR